MGLGGSKQQLSFPNHLESTILQEQILGEKFFGLENFGNTCYCNATLQALYFCTPFRTKLLQYYLEHVHSLSSINDSSTQKSKPIHPSSRLILSLGHLFAEVVQQKKKSGSLAPKKFIDDLRKDNETFRSFMQQDAHEFLNYLLNNIAETIQKELHTSQNNSSNHSMDQSDNDSSANMMDITPNLSPKHVNNTNPTAESQTTMETTEDETDETSMANTEEEKQPIPSPNKTIPNDKIKTFVHEIFQGILSTETRCKECDNRSYRDESFLDLSIDVSQNSSVNYCIKNFSSMEILKGNNKFYCDSCHAYQEAQKSIKIKTCPPVLILHLKRFKYSEELQDFKKLNYRVTFPFKDLKIQTLLQQEISYDLYAIVIHIGSGPNSGHYKCIIRSASEDKWILFDDHNVDVIENERVVRNLYGYPNDYSGVSETAYILFYKQNSSYR